MLARDVGREVAERGGILLCGGLDGVMTAAAEGARSAGGLIVGVLPGADVAESRPNPHIEIALFTGMSGGCNYINVCASDAIIAISKGWGTLLEIAFARKLGKPVVCLASWQLRVDLPRAETAVEAVRLAFAAITPAPTNR